MSVLSKNLYSLSIVEDYHMAKSSYITMRYTSVGYSADCSIYYSYLDTTLNVYYNLCSVQDDDSTIFVTVSNFDIDFNLDSEISISHNIRYVLTINLNRMSVFSGNLSPYVFSGIATIVPDDNAFIRHGIHRGTIGRSIVE